jgi:hypothetical protein
VSSVARTCFIGSLVLVAAAVVAACGKKGDPTPPPRSIPAAIGDLRVRQTGNQLALTMSYPAVTTAGLPLERLQALEILVLRLPAGAAAPLDARVFEATAPVATRLAGPELVSAVRGPTLRVDLDATPGTPLGPGADAASPPLQIAVRTLGPRGHPSPLSNPVTIAPATPPAPPDSIAVTAEPDGVRVAWTTTAPGAAGFNVFRRLAGEVEYWPIAELGPEARDHLDATAEFGTDYEYTVRVVAARDPSIESATAEAHAVQYRDAFAPPTPVNLVALAEEGRIRLLWDRVEAPDLAGYRLYRSEDGGAAVELPRDPGAGTDHTDDGVRPGASYVYRVTAVDRDDNESPPSEPATATTR